MLMKISKTKEGCHTNSMAHNSIIAICENGALWRYTHIYLALMNQSIIAKGSWELSAEVDSQIC